MGLRIDPKPARSGVLLAAYCLLGVGCRPPPPVSAGDVRGYGLVGAASAGRDCAAGWYVGCCGGAAGGWYVGCCGGWGGGAGGW